LNALLNNETKSSELLSEIARHTSVLEIIAASADVDRSDAYQLTESEYTKE
jgi:hypothetical protein